MAGISEYYYEYIKYLQSQQKRIAPLQLTGKLEEYFVREFVHFVFEKSSGKHLVLTNYGNSRERKIDMCFIRRDRSNPDPVIFGMVEAKYIRNIHRIHEDKKAWDEIDETLKSLHDQTGTCKEEKHGDLEVKLISKNHRIYGLVFASHVTYKDENSSDSKEFFNKILEKAKDRFKFYDLLNQNPRLDAIYNREKIKVLGKTAYATLKAGLWVKSYNK